MYYTEGTPSSPSRYQFYVYRTAYSDDYDSLVLDFNMKNGVSSLENVRETSEGYRRNYSVDAKKNIVVKDKDGKTLLTVGNTFGTFNQSVVAMVHSGLKLFDSYPVSSGKIEKDEAGVLVFRGNSTAISANPANSRFNLYFKMEKNLPVVDRLSVALPVFRNFYLSGKTVTIKDRSGKLIKKVKAEKRQLPIQFIVDELKSLK